MPEEFMQKEAAMKEQVDMAIDVLSRRLKVLSTLSLMNIQTLEKLKNKFSENFDPETEHNLIEVISELDQEVYNYAKKTQNAHYRIQELLNSF